MTKRILTLLALLLSLLLVLCGCSGEEAETKSNDEIKLYWNVERELYYDENIKTTFRGKAGDTYRVRFAIDGEQVDLFVKDSVTMDLIDSYKFMGLSVDKDNVVTGVYKPHEFTGGVAAYEYYVISIEGEQVICNNISNGRGLPLKLKINENTGIYDVADNGLLAGIPCDLQPGDQIYAVMGLDGYVSHIFVMPPFEPKPVYWNANRQYDNTSKYSTRTRSASGYYEIEFIVDGQSVIHKTQDTSLVDQIDGFAARCMSLEFDEEGIIIGVKHAKFATGGATAASWYHVKRLDKVGQSDDINLVADGFYAEKLSGSDKGKTATLSYANNCKIYDMSSTGAYLGETTELRLGDQIHCLTDPNGDVCIIFVVDRPRNLELYYNMERKYDTTKKESTRTMSADGFYHFEMSVNGKTVSLKTQDPGIVKTIDSRGAKVLGLELDGNIITAAYAPSSVEGANSTIFDYANVTEIAADGTVTAERNGETYTGMLSSGCEIYNVSNMATTKGEVTKLQVGDRVYGLGDMQGNINHIYVVGRYINSKVYWNLDRSYDSAAKTTKRKPAEDGYYYIKLAVGTETKTYKTKNKALVDKLDSYVAVALQTNGDVITAVYKYDCAVGYSGGGFGSWMTVKSISGSTIVAANNTTSNTGNMIAGCPVYNVSAGSSAPVRTTKLQVGDKIHGIKNSDGQIVVVYVVGRTLDLDLYYNIERKWDKDRSMTTRVPDANGWYWFDMAVNGKQVKLKTNNLAIVNAIDERAAKVLGLELKGDQILAAYKPSSVKSSAKTIFDFAVVTKISGNTITATKGDKTVTGTVAKNAKIYNVSDAATKIGEPSTIKVGDTIYGLGSDAKVANHVFITKRTMNLDLYYNIDRKWDKENSITTRVPDAEGWYWFSMTVNGKQVQLKTKDVNVVNIIDERAAKVLGLELKGDEILAAYEPSSVMGATSTVFDFAVVKSISGNTITATKGDKTYTGTLSKNAKIYNVSEAALTIGEHTTVQVGDTIYGLGTGKNAVNFVFVSKRAMDLELYYNMERMWDADKSVSTRVPDAEGWYWFSMTVNGKQVQLKTKDVNVVNIIDERAAKVLGLQLKGDEILAAYKPSSVMGATSTVFDFAVVKSISGNTITATKGDKTYTGTLSKNAKVYNVSQLAATVGEYTNVQVGDTIYGLGVDANVNYVYVTKRSLNLELYYNIERMWDADQAVSTRTPDAEGWYWFSMTANGKQVQLKTKDVNVVNIIDERAAKVLGLQLKGDEILAAYKPGSLDHSATTVFDFAVVQSISGNTITATKGDKTYTGMLAENAKIYNVSEAAATVGEFTTVQVGDTIYGLGTGKNAVNFVFVSKREVKPTTKTALCTACNETVTWNSWNGKTSLEDGHWYLNRNATVENTATIVKDANVCLDLCGYLLSGKDSVDRMFNIYGVLNIMDSGENGKVISTYANNEGRTGSVFYVQNSKDNGTGTLNLYGGTLTSSGNTKQGGIGGVGYQFNMYGGTITGGKALKGGNLYLEGAADVKLYGGQILGGEAEQGADIYTKRNVTLGGNAVIGNIYLESGKTIAIDGLTEGASIGVTLADTYGTVATNATQADLEFFHVGEDLELKLKGDELVIQQLVVVAPLEHEDHCVCGGWKDHTCETPTWEAWTGTWESGKYYALTQDHEVKSTIMIPEGQTLNLCLNGYDLIGAANVTRIFNVYGELNLCDHADENGIYAGDVISNYEGDNTQTGRIFYVQNKTGACFNMFGGNLISNSLTNKGGIGGTSKIVNIYAGTVEGGKATASGGILQIDGGVTTIYTTITGGQAPKGGDIYVSNGQLVVSGDAVITDVYLTSGKTIQIKELSEKASIGVTLADTYGDFATNAQKSDLDRFLVAEGLTKVYADGKLTITDGQTPEEPEQPTVHQHCICGDLGKIGDHTCGDAVVWEPWTGTWESGKYYYLTEDYNLTGMLTIGEGKTLNLCLNGNDIIGGSNVNRMLDIRGVLNLCDHADEEGNFAGDVISHYNGTDTKTGRVFYLQTKDNAVFNMFGGNLKSTSTTTDGGIGGVGKIMNVYAGTITGGTATGKGGNLKVEARSAVLTIYGGTISGGTAADGGNIYITGSGTVVVNGGTIQGGLENNVKNANNGGNVYVEKGTLELVSGTISGGYASNAGGSIRVQGDGVLNISGGILTGGRASGNGGNVYSVGAVNITGGSVTQGFVKSGKIGGNLYASGGSLLIQDDPNLEGAPSVTGGTAGTGGNIAIKVDNVTISGCTISGGTADKGGDIYFEKSDGTLTIADCGAVAVYVAAGTVNGDENVTITP